MGQAKGYTTVAAWKKTTTWSTPLAVGALEGIRYTGGEPGASLEFLQSEELSGVRSRQAGDRGNILHDPTIPMEFTYEGAERLLAQAMGSAAAPVQQGTDTAYLHVLKPSNELDGIHGSYVLYAKSKPAVLEYTTCKVNGFTLQCGAGQQRASLNFPLLAHKLNINEGAGVNTNTTAAAITFPSNRQFVNFAGLASAGGGGVRINASSGAGLGASDLVYPSNITITVTNALPADDVTAAYAPYRDEPVGGSWFDVTVSLAFTKGYQNVARIQDMLSSSATAYKMDMIFIGPLAHGTTNFAARFYFPSMQFTGDVPFPTGPDRIPETLNFSCSARSASPTGFPAGYTDALTIEIVNQRNSTALA